MAKSKRHDLPDGHEVCLGAGTVQVKERGLRGEWLSVADHAEASKALVQALEDAIDLARVAKELRFELTSDEIARRIWRGTIDPEADFDTKVGLNDLDSDEIARRIDRIPDEVLGGKRRELPDGHDLLIEPGSVKVWHGARWVRVANSAEACEVLADLVREEAPADALLSMSTVTGAALGAIVAGPVGAVVGGLVGLLGDEAREQGTQHEPVLARAVVYNDVLGMGMTDAEARADALARDEDLELAEYTTGTLAALVAWRNGRPDLVTLAPNGVVHRVDVDDTPEGWKGTGNDPAQQGDDDWRRPRRAPRARRRRPR